MAEQMTLEAVAAHRTVIVEGSDGVGKSTLARALVVHHGFTAVHSPRTPDHQNLVNRYRDLLARPGCLVLDRSFVSELVYGPLYRGGSRLTWPQALELADLVTARHGLFLHLTAPPSTIRHRLKVRDGHAPSLEEITALAEAYHRTLRALAVDVPVVTCDTVSNTLRSSG